MRSLAVALVAALLAGCLSPSPAALEGASVVPLPPLPRFDVLPGESVWFEASSDGTGLHVRLFRPDVSAEPAWRSPTILVMSPYFGYDAREDATDPASAPTYFRYRWLVDEFVPRGYVVAFGDVRGTGDSGGCLEQTAQLQWQDEYDVIEALGASEWSNGKVGMFGKSYDAETQQSAAVMAPPSLATIVPVSSVGGQYEYSFYDGVPYTGQAALSNGAYFATDGAQPPTTAQGAAQYPTRFPCQAEMLAKGADVDGDWDAFWDDREIRKHADKVEASVLYVHGLQDWNVKPVAIRDWFDVIPAPKRAILGQWAHDYPEENRFDPDWSRQDWRDTVVLWYDHWLLGVPNGIMEALPPVQVQDDAGVWRAEQDFPPKDATPVRFWLAAGALSATPVGLEEPLRVRENEEGFVRGNTGLPVPTADSAPYADRLEFVSEPLATDLRFSGWPTLAWNGTMGDITTAKREADAHFAAILYDVAPDGTERWVNRGYLSARHREGVESPRAVPTGESLAFALRFFPQDTVVPAGHSLKLVFQGSDDWVQPEGSLWSMDMTDAVLALPVVERDLAVVGLDVPLGKPIRE